jgi:hypothetical protein
LGSQNQLLQLRKLVLLSQRVKSYNFLVPVALFPATFVALAGNIKVPRQISRIEPVMLKVVNNLVDFIFDLFIGNLFSLVLACLALRAEDDRLRLDESWCRALAMTLLVLVAAQEQAFGKVGVCLLFGAANSIPRIHRALVGNPAVKRREEISVDTRLLGLLQVG